MMRPATLAGRLKFAKSYGSSRKLSVCNFTTLPLHISSRTRPEPPRRHSRLRGHLISLTSPGTLCFATSVAPGQNSVPGIQCRTEKRQDGQHVATITMSNPSKLNIVNSRLLEQLVEACRELSKDPILRAVVLTGGPTPTDKPPAFIGGADIKEMYALRSSTEARDFITRIHLACKALRDLPVPVIARVDGLCLGAGLEIMVACDLKIATSNSRFAMPEVKVGIPSVVEAVLLPGLIGMGRTRRLLYLAEHIDAAEAERWGLIDRFVSNAAKLDAAIKQWVGSIGETGPRAIFSQKRLLQQWENSSVDEGIQAGVDAFAEAYADGGKEPKEYMGRFINRKRP